MMKNLGGTAQQPGVPIEAYDPNFDPECAPYCWSGGLFEENGHDQRINPGYGDEEEDPQDPATSRASRRTSWWETRILSWTRPADPRVEWSTRFRTPRPSKGSRSFRSIDVGT